MDAGFAEPQGLRLVCLPFPSFLRWVMSALGQKRTLESTSGMSALPPIADIIRYTPKFF